MKKILVILIASISICGNLPAQAPDTLWTRTYGGAEREIGNAVNQTDDGGYIIAGMTESFGEGSEVYLIKTDSSGDILWTKTYGGTEGEWGTAVQQTSDNGYIISGFTSSFGNGDDDVYLIKTDSSGDTIWTKTYGGTKRELAMSVQQTSDNGFIVAGVTESYGFGHYDMYLIKTDSNGDSLWTKTYGGSDRDVAYSVRQTSDNGYIVAGYASSFSNSMRDVYIVKTDSIGDTVWTKTYGEDNYVGMGCSINLTSDNGYIITGVSVQDESVSDADFNLIRINETGDTLWTGTYGGSLLDFGFSGHQTSDGGFLLAGTVTNSLDGAFDDRPGNDIFIVKTDSNGDTLWTKTLGGTDHDGVGESGNVMQQTSDDGCVIVGSTRKPGSGNIDVWLIKFGPDVTDISTKNDNFPSTFKLDPNYPNPFNPATTIKYSIPAGSWQSAVSSIKPGNSQSINHPINQSISSGLLPVKLVIYDILGREIATLVNKPQRPGQYTVTWDASGFSSGVYFYTLSAGSFIETKKMMLLK